MTDQASGKVWSGSSRAQHLARGAILGAGVLAGWVAYDFMVFVGGGCPQDFPELLPICLAWILGAALLGAASARWAWLPWGLALLALGASPVSIARQILPDGVSDYLPRVLGLLLLALGATRWLAARWGIGVLRLALCAGVLAAFVQALYLWKGNEVVLGGMAVRTTWACALLTLAQIPAGLIPRSGLRALVSALLVLAAFPPTMQRARRVAASALRADLPAPEHAARAGAPNLLLIVLDTLRADHLSCYGYDRPTTPGLDAFAREHATRYTQARSTSPFTLPSHASLFTGLLPAEHGCAHPDLWAPPLATPHPTLAERLRELGYRSAAIVANCAYLSVPMRMDRGFEHFDSRRRESIGEYRALAQLLGGKPHVGRSMTHEAQRITDRAIRWLERQRGQGPFFLMLNYLDVHSPYLPPPDRDGLFADGPRRAAANPEYSRTELLYDRELHYLDEHVARLLGHLEAAGPWETTAIVVTADHGESLGEHGFPDHCWTLFDSMLRVPLLVKPAGGRSEPVSDEPIHGAEVHDLMLGLLGLEAPARSPTRPSGEWYPQRPSELVAPVLTAQLGNLDRDLVAWVEGTRKTIVASDGIVQAFDLLADPRELSPLTLSPLEVEQALRAAHTWWRENPVTPRSQEAGQAGVDLPLLRALGYGGG